jgi:hypothetical protein
LLHFVLSKMVRATASEMIVLMIGWSVTPCWRRCHIWQASCVVEDPLQCRELDLQWCDRERRCWMADGWRSSVCGVIKVHRQETTSSNWGYGLPINLYQLNGWCHATQQVPWATTNNLWR